jgi:hypothetical protein
VVDPVQQLKEASVAYLKMDLGRLKVAIIFEDLELINVALVVRGLQPLLRRLVEDRSLLLRLPAHVLGSK